MSQQNIGQLSKKPLPEVRASIADEIMECLEKRTSTPEEFRAIEGIIRLLMRDPEVSVRRRLAYNLQYTAKIPQDIIVALAQDAQEVALPILKNSPLLTDSRLISIIKNTRDLELLMAIAARRWISPSVAGALINSNMRDVVMSLLANDKVDLLESSYNDIIDSFHVDDKILLLVSARKKLPLPVVKKLFFLVSEETKRKLCQRYALEYDKMERSSVSTDEVPFITSTLVNEKMIMNDEWLRSKIAQYVNYFYRQGKLTISLLLRSLYEGNLLFFEGALAQLTSLPVATIRDQLRQEKSEKFNALCLRAGIPNSMGEAVSLLYYYALGHYPEQVDAIEEVKVIKEYKRQLVEYITSSGYDQTVPFMLYIKALVCSQLDKEGLIESVRLKEKPASFPVALTA